MDNIPPAASKTEEENSSQISYVLSEIQKIKKGNPSCVLTLTENFDPEIIKSLEEKGYSVMVTYYYDSKRQPKTQTKVKITNPSLEDTQNFSSKINDQMKLFGVDFCLNDEAQQLINSLFG